jgi:hypothetical protein
MNFVLNQGYKTGKEFPKTILNISFINIRLVNKQLFIYHLKPFSLLFQRKSGSTANCGCNFDYKSSELHRKYAS